MYRYRVKLKHKFIIVVHTGERNVAAGTAVVVVVVVASVHAPHRRPTETVKTFQSIYVHWCSQVFETPSSSLEGRPSDRAVPHVCESIIPRCTARV